jgi:hypothetical protein
MPPPATRRFVLPWEDSFAVLVLYVDRQGNVSADFLEGFPVFSVTGSPVAPNGDQDRFVLNVDNHLVVLRPDGRAFVHAVRREGLHPDQGPFTIRPPVATTGAAIGVSPDQARFVGRLMDRRIFVVQPDGGTLGYDVIPDGDGAFVQPPFAFGGAKVATDDDVLFVVGMNFEIVLIRRDGSVTGYLTDTNNNLLPPVTFAGPKIVLSPEGGDFVVTMGTSNSFTPGPQFSAVVVRRDRSVVGHTLDHRTVSAPFAVPMQPPG